jgi:hypothetical protein
VFILAIELVWRTTKFENIDTIDFKGAKIYMFVLDTGNDYILQYIGQTKKSLKARIGERAKFIDNTAMNLNGKFYVCCATVEETFLDKVEKILIKEMKPPLNASGTGNKPLKFSYFDMNSAGDIPAIHNWSMFWNNYEREDIWKGKIRKSIGRQFIVKGRYFENEEMVTQVPNDDSKLTNSWLHREDGVFTH